MERVLKTVSVEGLSDSEIKGLLARPRIDFSSILGTVSSSCLVMLHALLPEHGQASLAWHWCDATSQPRACGVCADVLLARRLHQLLSKYAKMETQQCASSPANLTVWSYQACVTASRCGEPPSSHTCTTLQHTRHSFACLVQCSASDWWQCAWLDRLQYGCCAHRSLPSDPQCTCCAFTTTQDLPAPQLLPDVTAAFDVAYNNIRAFHEAQRGPDVSVETMPGVRCGRVTRPINAVGLYVPGGTAVLPSSALMLAVPAQIAGCGIVVLATPPRPDGSITPEVLYCARKAGVTHVLKAGGAQAVAAMGWGTESVPKVDKLFGPGNQYVTAAKMLLTNSEAMVAIDMPAGPSEVLVIADAAASPAHVAADLLSQAEHGPDSQVVLLALPGVDLEAVEAEVQRQCDALPRNETARKALTHSCIVQVGPSSGLC